MTSTTSPLRLPIRALPIGVPAASLPSRKLASLSPTRVYWTVVLLSRFLSVTLVSICTWSVLLGLVDDAGVCHEILELGYLELQKALSLLGCIVFCVLREVALVPGLRDLSGNNGTLADGLRQFGLELLKTFGCYIMSV